ncbi:proteasome subunit alpha/beta [Holotrichia oblita]|uniref:Proteasome subunit alpha/beta n=1 Tax=Holotrichia oblita TaxID=644536 RepID=A0ACB9SYB2_HOLOL|nr:proteasome subunit alpha/beta [Holotrichia oblita]
MATERYSFSLTTFSPSGKLVQIEYALAAVAAGAPSVGIKASNGVVIATENKHKSILYDEHSVNKVEMITSHIGMVYSGMGPDYRLLVKQARKMAQQYFLVYKELIPTVQLVQRGYRAVMQEYTQSGGVRPFGVSLLICGWDNNRPYLFQCDPSGAYFAWKATAMGKISSMLYIAEYEYHVKINSYAVRLLTGSGHQLRIKTGSASMIKYIFRIIGLFEINEKKDTDLTLSDIAFINEYTAHLYSEDLELDDAVHTAILTLKESFEGQMTADNIEVGICDQTGFKRLDPSNVKDYLANIP